MLRRSATAVICASSLCLASASLAQAACTTAHPAADIEGFTEPLVFQPGGPLPEFSDKQIEANFTKARAAEGCNVPLVLPAGYDGMTPQQQMLWLFNNEREVRGLAPFKLDTTLMSQIALNHSKEMATYGYTNHPSPVNQPQSVFARYQVDPIFKASGGLGEDIAWGNGTTVSTYGYIYQDSSQGWGHRDAILGNYNWVGIGALTNAPGSQAGNYFTDDFANYPTYTPPATADTGTPEIGAVTYANGTATVTGVKDSAKNVNDQGANPYTAAITGVVFYTNNITETGESFNTVPATESPAGSGTWTAKVTVNTGDVLHAVAVDGSGNFTDSAPPAPAVPLKAGENAVAIPAAPAPPVATTPAGEEATEEEPFGAPPAEVLAAAVHRKRTAHARAVTPTARALVISVDRELGHGATRAVRVFVDGHWRVYRPGKSRNFALYAGEGVVVQTRSSGKWLPSAGVARFGRAPTLRLHKGWNFVAAPYPIVHLTCHATRLELANGGDKLEEISVGPRPGTGFIMRPNKRGEWGNDLNKVIPDYRSFWIKDAGSDTWVPNPVQYGKKTSGKR